MSRLLRSCMGLVVGMTIGLGLALPAGALQRPSRQHTVYFAGTPDELHVYRVYGARDGKTLMLIGGIQGDEPGGFLSADLYADIHLAKGNLIVVPRANFYSIIMNHRGPDGDMNRQFGDPLTARRHKKIVEILKGLMADSDLLLNLHDGSGFYRPRWEGPMANPMRYGQSIIADAAVYNCPDGRVLNLKAMALRVISKVNRRISNSYYHFHFNNHRTAAPDSLHKEQRLSATFYALTHCHIPAFGVETSKNLPSVAMKVRHHNLVINAFMEELGIVPESPVLHLAPPVLKYLVVSINGRLPVAVRSGASLRVRAGDRLKVVHIEANYERGLSCDLKGLGGINDLGQEFVITRPTTIVVRKDYQEIGRVKLVVARGRGPYSPLVPGRLYFLLEVQGLRRLVAEGESCQVVKGDRLVILDALSDGAGLKVNLKGYVPPGQGNPGEDRGYCIDTARELMRRYCRCPAGTPRGVECYQVMAVEGGHVVGRMLLRVVPPRVEYLVVRRRGRGERVYRPGGVMELNWGERVEIVDIKSNVRPASELVVVLEGAGGSVNLIKGVIDTTSRAFKRLVRSSKGRIWLVVSRRGIVVARLRLVVRRKGSGG